MPGGALGGGTGVGAIIASKMCSMMVLRMDVTIGFISLDYRPGRKGWW